MAGLPDRMVGSFNITNRYTFSMRLFLMTLALCAITVTTTLAQVANFWRGPARNGIYPETGLTTQWPAGGPEVIWAFEGLGAGFSSPVIANNLIYISGMEDAVGYIYILNLNGELVSKFPYGPEYPYRYPGSRTSPTVVGDLMYHVSSYATLVCMDTRTGEIKWKRDYYSDIKADSLYWGYTENILVNGDLMYATPGGKEHNVVALNRFTGQLVWSSPGLGRMAAYCSPLLFEHNNRKILATIMAGNVQGHDATTGELLWHAPFSNQWEIHPNTPIYSNGDIFFFTGYGTGGAKYRISSDGTSIEKVWESKTFDNQMGGAVLHNGYIYGSGDRNRFWYCVDWETGQNKWQSREVAKGTTIMADNMLYLYSERGELALVEPSPNGFVLRGKAEVTHGAEQHWAHLVVHNGRLYVRRGNALIAYRIK